MNKTRCAVVALLVGGLLAIFMLVAGGTSLYLLNRYLVEKQAAYTAPVVFIRTANEGAAMQEGDPYLVSVTASDSNPIASLEMWLDGELAEMQRPDPAVPGGALNFHALFNPSLDGGFHTLYWRAMDNDGLIGQSQLIAVEVQPAPSVEADQEPGTEDPLTSSAPGDPPSPLPVAPSQVPAEPGDQPSDPSGAPSQAPADPGDQTEEPPEIVFLSPSNQKQPTPDEAALEAGEEPPDQGIFDPSGLQDPGKPLESAPPGLTYSPDQDTVAPIYPQDINDPGQGFTPIPIPPADVNILEVQNSPLNINPLISFRLPDLPAAPTGLQAGFENCTVRLVWYDNADNETGFNVWIQRLGGPPQLAATLNQHGTTGHVMYEFPAPPFGIYSVWVEAVNGVLSQPSEIKGLAVNDADCPQNALAGMLEIEAVDMGVYNQKYDQVYCYVSLEGYLHRRVPDSEREFITVDGITGEIQEHWSGDSHILLPIPADGAVLLDGKCLGMKKNGPFEMGTFLANIPKEQWDGRRLEVKVDGKFTVGYRIRYFGPQQVKGKAKFIDTSIPQPTGLRIVVESSPDPVENDKLARHPTLYWKWGGDPSLLRGGFNILNYGKYFSAGPMREARQQLMLPSSCGADYDFQVEASYGHATSIPSPTLHYAQPPCKVMAEVHFQSIYADTTDDTDAGATGANVAGIDCDTLKVYGYLWVSNTLGSEVVKIASEENPADFHCKLEYSYKQLGASKDKFIMPLDPLNPSLNYLTWLVEDDGFTDNDLLGRVDEYITNIGMVGWLNMDKQELYYPPDPDNTAGGVVVKIRVRGVLYAE